MGFELKKSISFAKRKSALLLFMRCMLPKSPMSSTIIDTKKCAYDRYAYRNALGFPVIIYQALEIHIKAVSRTIVFTIR